MKTKIWEFICKHPFISLLALCEVTSCAQNTVYILRTGNHPSDRAAQTKEQPTTESAAE